MRRLYLLLVVALALGLTSVARAQEEGVTADLEELNNSGITGRVTIDQGGVEEDQTRVLLELEGAEQGGEYPAMIHEGTCEDFGEVVYELEAVTFNENAGAFVSVTVLDDTPDEVLSEQRAVVVHRSPEELDEYVACGDLPVPDMPDTGAGAAAGRDALPVMGLGLVGSVLAAGALMAARARSS